MADMKISFVKKSWDLKASQRPFIGFCRRSLAVILLKVSILGTLTIIIVVFWGSCQAI